jgi:hypothetical protein
VVATRDHIFKMKPHALSRKSMTSIVVQDLSFFVSFGMARLIVWRVIRRERRERAERRKLLKIVGETHQ